MVVEKERGKRLHPKHVYCALLYLEPLTFPSQSECPDSPAVRSTRLLPVAFVTLMRTTTLLPSRETSRVPSSRLLNTRSPSEFHVRNWKPSDMVLWPARPGSCRKLVALKKTGKVWVSTQEKDKLRCRHTRNRDTKLNIKYLPNLG